MFKILVDGIALEDVTKVEVTLDVVSIQMTMRDENGSIQREGEFIKSHVIHVPLGRVEIVQSEEAKVFHERFVDVPCELWKRFKGDFDSMTDEEIKREIDQDQQRVDEAIEWLEAVVSWEKAGKPRNTG